MRRRSKRWQRESTVTGTLRISVVAKMNFTCGGGSSSVFNSALKALRESMWTSSTMNTLVRACSGRKRVASMISRTSSTPVREAASISTTSGWRSSRMARQLAQTPHGSGGGAAGAVGADAVERAGDDAGGGGLADAAHAGEHEGVGDAAQGEGVAQDADHRILADHVIEAGGPVFAREHPVGRGGSRTGRMRSPNRPGPVAGGSGRAASSSSRPDMRRG